MHVVYMRQQVWAFGFSLYRKSLILEIGPWILSLSTGRERRSNLEGHMLTIRKARLSGIWQWGFTLSKSNLCLDLGPYFVTVTW